MADLFRKDSLIKPDSVETVAGALANTRIYINSFQTAPTNYNTTGTFKDYFFCDCFDSRTGNIYRIYSDACATMYNMTPDANGMIMFVILDVSALGGGSSGFTIQ